MVGGLVQQDHVRLCYQELAKAYPCALAPGKLLHMLLEFPFRKTKAFQHPYDLAFIGRASLLLELKAPAVIGVH